MPLLLLATCALIRLDPDMTPRVEVCVSGLLLLLLLMMSLWKITVAVLLVTLTALVLLTFDTALILLLVLTSAATPISI